MLSVDLAANDAADANVLVSLNHPTPKVEPSQKRDQFKTQNTIHKDNYPNRYEWMTLSK